MISTIIDIIFINLTDQDLRIRTRNSLLLLINLSIKISDMVFTKINLLLTSKYFINKVFVISFSNNCRWGYNPVIFYFVFRRIFSRNRWRWWNNIKCTIIIILFEFARIVIIDFPVIRFESISDLTMVP